MKVTITQVGKRLQSILGETANKLAEESGLIKRQRKVTGANLSQMLVLGWLSNPAATLEELCQTGAALGLQITPQGLDQRFTEETSVFLQRLLEETVAVSFMAEGVATPLLQRFNGVYLTDSSIVQLPNELQERWLGFGGRVATSEAALKMQVRLDLLRGRLEGPLLCPGRLHDRTAAAGHEPLPTGALHLADLGYWKLDGLIEMSDQENYWLSRLHVQPKIVDAAGREWSQVDFLQHHGGDWLDMPVRLGVKKQVPARLLAVRVPPAVATERRQRLQEQARSRWQPISQARLQLADWTLLVTNVPAALLSLEEALLLARLRWQIELLFKLWKSEGQIATWRSQKPWRILCELYAKLIGMIFQHWFFLLSHWSRPDRSWLKAAHTVRQHTIALAIALPYSKQLRHALSRLADCLAHGCRINKSRASPRHHQLLAAISNAQFA